MSRYPRIVILTGAGMSAESGISTFRDKDGIWAKVDYREVATPEGFARNPAAGAGILQHAPQGQRPAPSRTPRTSRSPGWRRSMPRSGEVLVVTQNIDPCTRPPAASNLIHMHGEHRQALCNHCQARHPWGRASDLAVDLACAACGRAGGLRPDVVWFGEMPYHMDRIYAELAEADLFISIGTSGNVYPAAGFVAEARRDGAHTVELNLEPSEGASLFHETHHGPATKMVPMYVERLLEGAA